MKITDVYTAECGHTYHPSPRTYIEGGSFQCRHCRQHVLVHPFFSGVQHRNHCPYCLWSRHLDLFQAGDRLSACKGNMRPLGLTAKRTRSKYAAADQGELMLVHRCEECGKLSANRLAADDDAELVLRVYVESFGLDSLSFQAGGIDLLTQGEQRLVAARLFGSEVMVAG